MASASAVQSRVMSSSLIRRIVTVTTALLIIAGIVGGCGGDVPRKKAGPTVARPPAASDFVDVVDNPWMPWKPGTRWRFVGQTADGTEVTLVTVSDSTKVVDGVRTTVVHDVVRLDGRLLEDTYDWYAQDATGNVWYFGEATKEYDGDRVDSSGSWEAGVDGARAGIVMKAHPRVGDAYRQEYYPGEAEDEARVVATDATATVPYGDLGGLLADQGLHTARADR